MRYIAHTPEDIARMLETIGAASVEELFAGIPQRDRTTEGLTVPPGLDEGSLLRHLGELAGENRVAGSPGIISFLGAGAYRHGISMAMDNLLRRSEFLTCYTPYQPEISQGSLQQIFEFQTIVSELFGMEVANASMYDGATAAAESLLMAMRLTKRARFVVSAGVHPEYRETCATFLSGLPDTEIVTVGLGADGRTDAAALQAALAAAPCAGALLQSPNFFGVIEDLAPLIAASHAADAIAAVGVNEIASLGVLRPPGACGADIVFGDGLGFAIPVSFGGPGVGLFATRDRFKRQVPGRLVGETVDADGHRGYVLTLATREQHIRRERATSNICTNQGLIALAFTIQAALYGRSGLVDLARLNFAKAEYAKAQILALPGFALAYHGPTFNEFALTVPGGDAAAICAQLGEQGILPGVDLGRFDPEHRGTLLVNVTEQHRRQDIDALAAALQEVG